MAWLMQLRVSVAAASVADVAAAAAAAQSAESQVVVQNGAMTSQSTAEAPCLYLGVFISPVFCHLSVVALYLNTSV